MKRSLLTATVVLMASSGLAFAQSATTDTASDSMAGFSSWDQTTRDSFFTDDNMLRSSDELRSAWDALDSTQQAQIRADCLTLQADASGSVSTQDSAAAGSSMTAPGTSSETTASTTMSDSSTAGSSTAGATTSDSMTGSSASADASGAADMPSVASLGQLCDEVESF